MNLKQYLSQLEREGWTCTKRKRSGHYKLTHPRASGPVFTGSTPGDRRSLQNLKSQVRRALRPTEPGAL